MAPWSGKQPVRMQMRPPRVLLQECRVWDLLAGNRPERGQPHSGRSACPCLWHPSLRYMPDQSRLRNVAIVAGFISFLVMFY